MTYSLVAAEPESGICGVAVQSKFPAIGGLSAWAMPGVGAIATQAWIQARHGSEGLELMRGGLSPESALEKLVAGDDGRDQRQIGIVDVQGRSAAYTGAGCMEHAGHLTGPGYAAQGNLLASDRAVAAMVEAFTGSAGEPLAERLILALEAAESEGGDRRGQQAAAVKVVAPGLGYGGGGIVCDLRVDDHARPLEELRRLWQVHERHFGQTPREQWLPIEGELRLEVATLLADRGWAGPDLGDDLEQWAGVENMEERVDGGELIDPVVLATLRGS